MFGDKGPLRPKSLVLTYNILRTICYKIQFNFIHTFLYRLRFIWTVGVMRTDWWRLACDEELLAYSRCSVCCVISYLRYTDVGNYFGRTLTQGVLITPALTRNPIQNIHFLYLLDAYIQIFTDLVTIRRVIYTDLYIFLLYLFCRTRVFAWKCSNKSICRDVYPRRHLICS